VVWRLSLKVSFVLLCRPADRGEQGGGLRDLGPADMVLRPRLRHDDGADYGVAGGGQQERAREPCLATQDRQREPAVGHKVAALRKGFSEGCAIRTGIAAARPPTVSRDEGWTERCAPSEARSLRQPEDELPADGTKLLERVGAWLKQRARMKPAGKSFFNGTSWIGL
jgi:hypothetical protein